jgi:threonylcarbamoyladenosine tRNA methylthiotransferase MtaB
MMKNMSSQSSMESTKKVYIETLGCKVNQSESACMFDDFLDSGYVLAQSMHTADVIVVNTCSVTARADYKSRYYINQAKKIKEQNPAACVIVTGCYSQRHIADIQNDSSVDIWIDNNSKDRVVKVVSGAKNTFLDIEGFDTYTEQWMSRASGRSRAFLKVQDGCDCGCAFCAVPSARGRSRSRSFDSAIKQVEHLLKLGYREIVLGGINLGMYGIGHNDGFGLSELLQKMSEYDELRSIRLSSVEPQLFTDKLIDTVSKIDKICPHFHIPLQSGSDTVLSRHGRSYSVAHLRAVVSKLQSLYPDGAFGFDVIVGLPGESERDFMSTYELLSGMDFSYLHVFLFSRRKGTRAYNMSEQVDGRVAKQRSELLHTLSSEKHEKYMKSLIERSVILSAVPEVCKRSVLSGTSDRYVTVYWTDDGDGGNVVRLLPKARYEDGLWSEVVTDVADKR